MMSCLWTGETAPLLRAGTSWRDHKTISPISAMGVGRLRQVFLLTSIFLNIARFLHPFLKEIIDLARRNKKVVQK